jgi:hypothetical protein
MIASLVLVAGLTCAQLEPDAGQAPTAAVREAMAQPRGMSAPRAAASKVVAVTVYQGQALVTREVSVPEGDGTFELVVGPLPAQTVENSLYSEGADGLRVLSTRYRSRAVKDDTRGEVRAKEEEIARLKAEAQRLEKEISVEELNLQYLGKLEGFTAVSLSDLTKKGRLDSDAIVALSKFVMENRGTKTRAATELRAQLQAANASLELAKRQLGDLTAGSGRVERDAVMTVHKTRAQAGTVRLGYLVGYASWTPQYRLRGSAENGPVRLEYLAAVVQQSGEPWPNVRVTLSTARPTLDSAPPDLLPLRMAVADPADSGPIEATDDRSQKIVAELARPLEMRFANQTPLEDVLKYIKNATTSRAFTEGIPIYVDPVGLQTAEATMTSAVSLDLGQVPLRTSLRLLLKQLGLTYKIRDGLLTITASTDLDPDAPDDSMGSDPLDGSGGVPFEQARTAGGAALNQAAATDQADELRVTDSAGATTLRTDRDTPGVTFALAGPLDVPSRRDPQLLEVARAELKAEYYAKAVPVLTPRVYRLAKLTNASALVLLPGEATVYVGSDFVGRMRLPLVAAGEPFVAGFGVDPQLQVGRRLIRKSRSVQGGNQVFSYEFRISLRNYRSAPVTVQLWDRLPRPSGEAVAVNLVKTSAELSTDSLYQRTAKLDNLLRWDVDVPQGTVGDKTIAVTYEFRLEYARDLPQPRFVSGGLKEAPIGGSAMGGMGGMAGGTRSVGPGNP